MKKLLILFNISLALSANTVAQNCPYETSVPEEMFRGRYTEADMTYGNPYTMFNRRKDNWSLSNDTSKLIQYIINGVDGVTGDANNDYSIIYKNLYKYDTKTSEPGICPEDEDCDHPKWVKNQAIVYLIGLRYSRTNNRDTFTRMTQYDRNQFAERAKNGLVNLNPNIISCYFGEDCGKVHKKAFDLIQYLQAYDLLKTGGYIAPNDGDRNGLDCSPRSKLREFSRNMYIQAEDVIKFLRADRAMAAVVVCPHQQHLTPST